MTELPTEQTTSQTYRNAFLVAAVLWGISFQFMPLFELSGVLVKVQHLLLLFFALHAATTKALSGRFTLRLPYFLVVLIWFYIISAAGWLINALVVEPHENFLPLFAEHILVVPLLLITFSFFRRRVVLDYRLLYRVSIIFLMMAMGGILYLAALADVSVPGVFRKYLAGDGTLQFLLFRKIYEGIAGETSAARHTLMYVLFLLAAFLRCARLLEERTRKPFSFDLLEVSMLALVIFVGVSRKVTLTVLIFYLVALTLEYRHLGKAISDRYRVWLIAGTTMVSVSVIILIANIPATVVASLQDRYIVDVITNSRIYQFNLVFSETLANLGTAMTGHGLGPLVSNGHYAHNLVLFFLHQGGLIMALLALCLFLYVVGLCVNVIRFQKGVEQHEIWLGLAAAACFLILLTRFGVGNKGELAIIGIVAAALAGTVLEQMPSSRRLSSRN